MTYSLDDFMPEQIIALAEAYVVEELGRVESEIATNHRDWQKIAIGTFVAGAVMGLGSQVLEKHQPEHIFNPLREQMLNGLEKTSLGFMACATVISIADHIYYRRQQRRVGSLT